MMSLYNPDPTGPSANVHDSSFRKYQTRVSLLEHIKSGQSQQTLSISDAIDILPIPDIADPRLSSSERRSLQHCSGVLQSGKQRHSPYKLVIFDKDGTLVSFDSMWGPWSEHNVLKLEERTGKKLSADIFEYFNYDVEKKKFNKSCLARDTHEEVRGGILDIMREKHGIPADEAETVFDQCWGTAFDVTGISHLKTVKPLGNVREIFSKLKENSIKTAVCSSDVRESVELALNILGVTDMVEKIVCADDTDNTPKPAPDNVHMICNSLEVDPKDTVVIGDTYYDTKMGRSSDCGLVIGLLSGQSEKADLEDADFVTSNLDDVLPLICDVTAGD